MAPELKTPEHHAYHNLQLQASETRPRNTKGCPWSDFAPDKIRNRREIVKKRSIKHQDFTAA